MGKETHLEARHSQLRQAVYVGAQDFVFPHFERLSAPAGREEAEEKPRGEGMKSINLFLLFGRMRDVE